MRILTVLGTRPEIIRLSVIIDKLDRLCEHVVVHTGQNFDNNLSDIFFKQLGVRQPDLHLGVESTSFAQQAAGIVAASDSAMEQIHPDRLLILGDTNSGLSALPAARRRIPVFHLEAGNRCYDDRVPEEINRRVIDHCSTILMPYTYRSKENLVREGIARERIFVVGNPIFEVMNHYRSQIDGSEILQILGLGPRSYLLASMHRAENVDGAERLASLLQALEDCARVVGLPVVVSLHPRTADKIGRFGLATDVEGVSFLEPMGFFDWVHLEASAGCVISDSGTVQEECCILGVPNVTIRDVTERPETVECGSNILTGMHPRAVVDAVQLVMSESGTWAPPPEYLRANASQAVAKVVLGFYPFM